MTELLIRELEKSFEPGLPVVRGFSLRVPAGEFLALLGPSGCGKTTVLRMLCGLEEPDGGCIIFNDQVVCDTVTCVPPERRGIGMVFQDYALWPHMRVEENVAYGLRQQRLDRDAIASRVDETLALVELEAHRHKFPHQLSGGEQQRVAVARALALRPRLLLMDEPLSNLDAKIREEMRLEIKRLQRQLGITTILVTHDQDDAMVMADRIAVMNAGTIEQVAPPNEIYARPATLFVADFIGESNVLAGTVTDPERQEVLTPIGPLQYERPGQAFTREQQVGVIIRPEHFSLAPTGIVGYVNEVVFRGGKRQILLQVRCTWLKVDLKAAIRPQIGDRLCVRPERVTLVPEVPEFARGGAITAPPPTGLTPIEPVTPDTERRMRAWLDAVRQRSTVSAGE